MNNRNQDNHHNENILEEIGENVEQLDNLMSSSAPSKTIQEQSHKVCSLMERMNQAPFKNTDKFPLKKVSDNQIVLVVFTHKRHEYFRLVIESLRQVEGISEVLLIISHDGYFQPMVDLVKTIDFCRVKEIFFPYSPHVLRNSHPGTTEGDCPSRISRDQVERLKCFGDPDHYGNYREAKFVALKVSRFKFN